MENTFLYTFSQYARERDNRNAARLVMSELGRLMANDRDNFITMLKFAHLPAHESMTDAQLIQLFVENSNNPKLLVSAAFYINQHNKKVGFDGEEQISDRGVKAVHKVMYNHFDAYAPQIALYSNAGGAWAGVADSALKLGGNIINKQHAKKHGVMDTLQKREDAKQAMANAAIKERKAQQTAAAKQQAEKDKRTKILLYGGLGLAGLTVIIGTIVYFKKN